MKVDAMLSMIRDSLTVSRVYGEPVERDGVTVIPAALVVAGGGGGVRWVPAVDVNRLLIGLSFVAFRVMRRRRLAARRRAIA